MNGGFFNALQRPGHPLIIAEIGAKYGSMQTMQDMVRAAAACGVDMVKFQTYRAETIAMPGHDFTMEDGSKVSQFDFFKRHELTADDHALLDGLCKELGIGWTSTPSHVADLELLERFDLPCYKTGSDDLTNIPFLRAIAQKGRPMLVSTGMCSLEEIAVAVKTIFATGNEQLVLLHCVVSYPSRAEDANLRVIETLKNEFGVPVGLSDHTQDEFTSVLATQMGAVVIEKHLTLDHAMKLPDHEASLDPAQFRRLVEQVRRVPLALGDGIKRILPTEEKWRAAARKSIFSAKPIRKGQLITADDLMLRRPSTGLHPHHFDEIVGQVAQQDIPGDTEIRWDMVKAL
jgi:N,N'-diacetyllegionaminate synthase